MAAPDHLYQADQLDWAGPVLTDLSHTGSFWCQIDAVDPGCQTTNGACQICCENAVENLVRLRHMVLKMLQNQHTDEAETRHDELAF